MLQAEEVQLPQVPQWEEVQLPRVPQVKVMEVEVAADPCSELWEVAVVSLALSSTPMML